MHSTRPSPLLHYALLADALASGATGLLAFAGARALADLLGLPTALLRYAGLMLLPYAAFLLWLGTRASIAPRTVYAVVAVNALWAVDSVVLLASGWVAPTALGIGFVLLQALAVAGFAAAQAYGLRAEAAGGAVHA